MPCVAKLSISTLLLYVLHLCCKSFIDYSYSFRDDLLQEVLLLLSKTLLLNIALLVVASKDNIATADSKTLKLVKNHLPWLRKKNLTLGSGQWSLDNLEKIRSIQLWLENVDILTSAISVISCSLLIFGVLQSRYKFIYPTLIWMPVDVAIYLMNIMVVFLFICNML